MNTTPHSHPNDLPPLEKKLSRWAGFTPRKFLDAVRGGFRKIAGILLIVVAIFALQKFLPVQAWLQSGTATFRDLGPWGIVLFWLTYVVLVMIFTPGPLLSLTAGTIYGLQKGYFVAATGSLLGASVAFLIAHLFREKATRWVSRYQAFKAVERAGSRHPIRTLFSVHMCPLFPAPIANYMLTLAGIRFPLYLFGAWLGMLPGILFYVYIGNLGGNLALEGLHLDPHDLWTLGAARVALWIIGAAATFSFGLLVKRHSK
jgi:uncharacterized membrane protein YdjX (TVP38/TMEM64 family)